MFQWLLNRLEKAGRKSVIMDRDGLKPYLTRYYALYPDSVQRERGDILFNVLIHQFMQSDDPVLHTHPWWYFTLILKGGYWEHLPGGKKKWRGPGSIRFGMDVTHWVEIPEPEKTWTFFIRGRTRKMEIDGEMKTKWGFINEFNEWEYWEHYLSRKSKVGVDAHYKIAGQL
jgi:hypothetical protein